MTWLGFALITAFLYSVYSFFTKLVSGTKINYALAGIIIQFIATFIAFLWLLSFKARGMKIEIPQNGVWFALLGGITIGSSIFFVFRAYSSGNVSIVAPIILIGSIAVASILGIIFLHERVTLNIIVAYILVGISIFLLSRTP